MSYLCGRIFVSTLFLWKTSVSFNLMDYTHYLDYVPLRQEGIVGFEDFRTSLTPPTHIRNRKMEIGQLKLQVEDVLLSPVWPTKWPYGYEDFRPFDYTRDEPINTIAQYQFSQNLLASDSVSILPGLLKVPIRRHFILPKDKLALAEHMREYFFDGAAVLELFSTYESILPHGVDLGSTVGVGWFVPEMKCNPLLDDMIEQDITVDPFLPLADNYFDFVVVPAMFQLFQRPLDMFKEINRVLKPGGTAIIGVKLAYWSFLGLKQGRYYAETNYLEDVLALGSFFHFADGFSKPEAFDLTLPEVNIVGKIKDVLFPQPRMDFYAVVQATKRRDSPHGRVARSVEGEGGKKQRSSEVKTVEEGETLGREGGENNAVVVEEGQRYRPKTFIDPQTGEEVLGPFY